MKKVLVLLGILFFINTVFSQNITKAEYFFDRDTVPGSGIAVPNFTPGDIVNFSFTIPTSGLSNGFHFLNIRVADANGVWSRYETRYFYLTTTNTNTTNITGAEYFIDRDTVPGSGTPINIGSAGSVVNFNVTFPPTLSSGFHSLAIRVKDQEGKWSIFEERSFYITPDPVDAPPIVAAEYFFDVDPGIGNASSLLVTTPGNIVTQTFLVPVPVSLSQGDHVLAIRVKDQQGHWSFYASDTITVGTPSGSITCPGNVTVNPYTNNCKAYVFNIDAVGLPQNDSSYSYTLTGATTGSGIGTASGLLFNAGVTTVTYALVNSPTINCSFTITVNPSVTPTAAISFTPSYTVCEGTLIMFSCNSTNGGSATTTWQWKKNGINVGTSSPTYRDTTLQNHDTITVTMTSAISCAVPQTVTSAPVIMSMHERITPSVSITANSTSICPGQSVTFTATPVNGGTQPIYQWVKNGVPADLGMTYQTSELSNGDSVYVILYNTTDCIPNTNITSNVIHITVAQTITPFVSISQSPATICSGTTATFTATSVNGGSTPSYQWKVNDINVGNNSSTYQAPNPVNGSVVKVVMTSSLGCASSPSVTSNSITMIVNDSLQEFVSITASANTICAGTPVSFIASESGSGSGTFQWKLNGNNVGTNSLAYRNESLQNGDKVKVVFTPTFACSPTNVTSNEITIIVTPAVTPSVGILASTTSICTGQQVTFTAIPVNGGATPSYQWKLNDNNVGTNSPTYQNSSLMNGDVIKLVMTSSIPCTTGPVVSSNSITMTVNTGGPASVSIDASQTSICAGQQVTFTATVTNGGTANSYEWTLNNSVVGSNTSVYQTTSLHNGDVVRLTVQPYGSCSGNAPVNSNSITMNVSSQITYYRDMDGDGYGNAASGTMQACGPSTGWVVNNTDCNDNNSAIHPGAIEICGNGIDDDCDGQIDEACESPDNDGDGYTVAQGDCNDNNASIYPGATEVCGNGIDDDCDGQIDEGCGRLDNDGDGYTVAEGDCNDNNTAIHPGAIEICGNGIDDDCDGQVDENCTQILPTLIIKTYPIKEGDAGFTTLTVEVSLDRPAPVPVTVKYKTINDDAIAGLDYESASGTITIPAGKTSGSFQARIIGDLIREKNERFNINFSESVNVLLPADPNSRIMIIDDDKGKSTTAANSNEVMMEQMPFKIPTVTRRNQVWMIPRIGNYENEVLVMNVQGQIVSRFVNYNNQTPLGTVASGIYFYQIRIAESDGQYKYYSGRLLITE